MASTVMILHLPQLFLPHRLSSIKSVEMLWHLRLYQDSVPHRPLDSGLAALHSLLDCLPSTFPHLRKLYVSLQGHLKPKNVPLSKLMDLSEPVIMEPVDDMVRRLGPHVQECRIAIPFTLYEPRRYKATGTTLKLRWGLRKEWQRIWRELPDTETKDSGARSAHLRGYWVELGQIDVPRSCLSLYAMGDDDTDY
jgi:hypothetical protein